MAGIERLARQSGALGAGESRRRLEVVEHFIEGSLETSVLQIMENSSADYDDAGVGGSSKL
jgi:hypothetical protein